MAKDGYILSASILEVQPTGKTTGKIVWEWHAWDHLIQDFDETKANYGDVGAHRELIDLNFGDATIAAMVAKPDELKKTAPSVTLATRVASALRADGLAAHQRGGLQRRPGPDHAQRFRVQRVMGYRPQHEDDGIRRPHGWTLRQGRRSPLSLGEPSLLPAPAP